MRSATHLLFSHLDDPGTRKEDDELSDLASSNSLGSLSFAGHFDVNHLIDHSLPNSTRRMEYV
jgi:hypothetical protein